MNGVTLSTSVQLAAVRKMYGHPTAVEFAFYSVALGSQITFKPTRSRKGLLAKIRMLRVAHGFEECHEVEDFILRASIEQAGWHE